MKKKIFSKSNISSKPKALSNHKRNENKMFFNKLDNEGNFYNSCNNFFKTHKQRFYNTLFNETNNIKEIKINNFNINHIYNNFYETFRIKRINNENTNKAILPVNQERKGINNNIIIGITKKFNK